MKDWSGLSKAQKKKLMYIYDLLRNEEFISFMDEYDRLAGKTMEKIGKGKKVVDKEDPSCQLLGVLAAKYGLDFEDLIFIVENDHKWALRKGYNRIPSVCTLEDRCNEIQGGDVRLQTKHIAYPVAIGINRLASQRDVTDFVKKHWKEIEQLNKKYRRGKVLIIKERQLDHAIVDFIYENKDKKCKELKSLLDERFPHNGLVYYEINNLIREERIRREKKINLKSK
ncbi:MAG: hypothetical protein ABID64_00155 [Nitrospirota bacterium]